MDRLEGELTSAHRGFLGIFAEGAQVVVELLLGGVEYGVDDAAQEARELRPFVVTLSGHVALLDHRCLPAGLLLG